MQIPHERFDVFMKLRCNPGKEELKERLNLCIKAYTKELDTELETDEEDSNSSDPEIIHGVQSENEADL